MLYLFIFFPGAFARDFLKFYFHFYEKFIYGRATFRASPQELLSLTGIIASHSDIKHTTSKARATQSCKLNCKF